MTRSSQGNEPPSDPGRFTADIWGLGWRSIFFINLPVAALGLLGSLFLHDPLTRGVEKLDAIGAVLLFTGLVGIVIPLLEGQALGWPWWCFVLFVVAAGVLHRFWRYESTFDGNRSRGRHVMPLVPPRAVTAPGVRISLVAVALFYSIAAFFLIFSEHEQAVGRTPLEASLDILPLGIGFLVGPLTVPHLMRIMPRRIAALGLCLETIGFLAFAGLVAAFDQTSWAAAPLALIGFGQGLALPSLIRITVTHIPLAFAGLASGLVTATLQISAALSRSSAAFSTRPPKRTGQPQPSPQCRSSSPCCCSSPLCCRYGLSASPPWRPRRRSLTHMVPSRLKPSRNRPSPRCKISQC
ncbi:MFS transporter [Actinomadura luteofluorescens]|uniref:MFS transporter n=1 Tax=Actinomadura luteofluorescens TaxID=46163 RepID=UPI0030CB3BC3